MVTEERVRDLVVSLESYLKIEDTTDEMPETMDVLMGQAISRGIARGAVQVTLDRVKQDLTTAE